MNKQSLLPLNKTKAITHQVSMVMPEKTRYLDPETREDLKDKKHILIVEKAREEYRNGNVTDFRKFLSGLK